MNFYPYSHENLVCRDGDLAVLTNRAGRLCGYCAFSADEVPKEWHGNYSADALQYLQIHGGLTYCEVSGGDEDARIAAMKAARDAISKPPESATHDESMAYFTKRHSAADAAALSVPYTHIVFGFDCSHLHDENDPRLADRQYVLELARQMRQQIAAFARIVPQWREANRHTRIEMVDEIRRAAGIRVEPGFCAMIGMLAGASEFGEQQSEH